MSEAEAVPEYSSLVRRCRVTFDVNGMTLRVYDPEFIRAYLRYPFSSLEPIVENRSLGIIDLSDAEMVGLGEGFIELYVDYLRLGVATLQRIAPLLERLTGRSIWTVCWANAESFPD